MPPLEKRNIKLDNVIINLQTGMITFLYFERENLTKTNVSSQKSVGIRTGKSELLLTVMLASHPSISDSGSLLCSEYEMRSGRGERLQPLHHY